MKFRLLWAGTVMLLLSCQQKNTPEWYRAEGDRLEAEARNKVVLKGFDAFVRSPGYRHSRDIWRGPAVNLYNPAESYVEVLLNEQRGRLYIEGRIAMDFPLCSGQVGGMETPKGTFRISQKVEKEYRSNLYGSFIEPSTGRVVQGGVSSTDPAPAGTVFQGAEMPYWMRFNGAIGLHVGNVYRSEDSHGCVRVPVEACSILFEKLAVGSRVMVR